MFLRNNLMISATLLTLCSSGVAAQEQGDVSAGLKYAKSVCAECHGVEARDKASPDDKAPTFKAISNTSAMTGRALAVWLQSPHPSMPQIIVPPEKRDDVIAYILSLNDKQQK
ncbi:MAG: c-type cytochrome [Hyphomicrobium sp.]